MELASVCVPFRPGTPLAVNCLWPIFPFRERQLWIDSCQWRRAGIDLSILSNRGSSEIGF